MPRRSRPMLVAPLIPFVAILGIFGVDALHGTQWLWLVVAVWVLSMGALAAFVIGQMRAARRRKG